MERRDVTCNGAEIQEIIDSLLDCNKSDYSNVNSIFSRLSKILNQQDIYTDQEKEEIAIGLALLKKHATPWLVSLLKKVPINTPDENVFLDDISNLMSLLCGKLGIMV
jgi:hypothetical protein